MISSIECPLDLIINLTTSLTPDLLLFPKKKKRQQHFAGITALLLSPHDSSLLFSASRDASIRRWEIKDGGGGEEEGEGEDERMTSTTTPSRSPSASPSPSSVSASFSASFAGHGDWVTSLAMPHHSLLASASYDRTVRLWDARAGHSEGRGFGGGGEENDGDGDGDDDDENVERRASSPSASTSTSSSSSSNADLPPLATLVGHSDYVTCLASLGEAAGEGGGGGAHSPPRRLASAGLGGEVLLWDLSSLSSPSSSSSTSTSSSFLVRPSALPAARASVFSLASDSTGDLLAVGGPGGALRLVDARACGRGEGADFRGHADVVRSISLSPCGTRMVSASSDRTLRLWDVAQRRCVCVLAPHTDSVWAVAPWLAGKQQQGGGKGGRGGRGRSGNTNINPPPSSASPSASSASWGDDLLSAGRDGVVYRVHVPSRAAEAVAALPPSRSPGLRSSSFSSSSAASKENYSVSASSPPAPAAAAASCSAIAADFARSLVWVAATGDPGLMAWRVPQARPSASGGVGGGGGGGGTTAAAAALSSTPPPLSLSLPVGGRTFHVPSSPLVRARQAAFGGGGGTASGELIAAAAAGSPAAATKGGGGRNLLNVPSSFHRQGLIVPPPAAGACSAASNPLPVVEVPGAAPPCVEARWLPDRRRFLARDCSGRVDLWDAASGSPIRAVLPAATAAEQDNIGEKDHEERMRAAERLCWTPAVGAHWAQLDASLGAPRLTLDKSTAFSSELYSLTDLGHRGAPDDLKVNSGVELLRAAAGGWVRELSAAEEEEEEEEEEKRGKEEGEPAANAAAEEHKEEEREQIIDDDRAAAAALVSSLRAAEAEAEAASAANDGDDDDKRRRRPQPSAISISAFRELESDDSSRLLVIAEGDDGVGTPLAVPSARIGAGGGGKNEKRKKNEKKNSKKAFSLDARLLLPRWSLDAVLHGPPAPPASASSSSAAASASTKMAFALEPHPRSGGLPQITPRRLSAPKVLSLAKVAAHARSKLCEPPHSLELGAEPLACFWDEERQREADEKEEREEKAEKAEKEGGEAEEMEGNAVDAKKTRNSTKKLLPPPLPPRIELCIGEFSAPLDLSLASAREHIWRHVASSSGGSSNGDMILWYRAVKTTEPRATRPLLGPE